MDGTQIVASSLSDKPTFLWAKETKWLMMLVLIGFAWLHIPASFLGQKYGGKIVLNLSLFITALCTLLTPIVVRHGKV